MLPRNIPANAVAGFAKPVLLMCGAEDKITPPEWHEEAGRTIKNARVAIVPGSGHILPLEAPDRVSEELMIWLGVTDAVKRLSDK